MHREGKLAEALEIYQALAQENPGSIVLTNVMALIHWQMNQPQKAITLLKKAIKRLPDQGSFYNSLGNIYSKEGKEKEAMQVFQQAIDKCPDYAIAWANLGNCYFRLQDKLKAQECYARALQLDANLTGPRVNLVWLFLKEKDFFAAEKFLNEIFALNPEHLEALYQLGQLRLDQEKFSEAVEQFEKYNQKQPNNPNNHQGLGLAYYKLEEYDLAILHFQKALELNPHIEEGEFHLATAYFLKGERSEAKVHYLRQLMHGPHLESLYNLGVILSDQQRHAEAIEYFQQLLQLDANHLSSHLNIAALYLKNNNTEAAIKHYQQALSIDPNNNEVKYILHALTQDEIPARSPIEYTSHLFDQYAPSYENHLKEYLRYNVPAELHKLFMSLINPMDHSLRILDLGCGTGLMAEQFKPQTKEIIGIDLSAEMLKIAANKRIYQRLENSDILDALNQYHNYDLIIAADVLPYLGDLKEFFLKTNKSLNIGGFLLISIEHTEQTPFVLQTSMRYAHAKNYINSLASDFNFEVIEVNKTILRHQFGKPVEGYLYLIKKL